jgi:hypothetical protein
MVVYVLEYFAVEPNGQLEPLDNLKCRAPTVDGAAEKARSIGKTVAVRNKRPHLCVIKDQLGKVWREVGVEAV